MAIPDLSRFTKGIFFRTLNGKKSFEPQRSSLAPAVNKPNCFFQVEPSGSSFEFTDLFNCAYMPVKLSSDWIVGARKSYFNASGIWSSKMAGGSWLKHKKLNSSNQVSEYYPITVAELGYRDAITSSYTRWYYSETGETNCRNYDLFNRSIRYIQSAGALTFTFSSSGVKIGASAETPWGELRHWISLGLQAGGEAGTNGGWGGNNGGSGGSAGGFWFGSVSLDEGTITLDVEGYSGGTNGHDGASIVLKRNGTPLVTVRGGGKGSNITVASASGLVTYAQANGGAGSANGWGASSPSVKYTSPFVDSDSVSFESLGGGREQNLAGGGGASVFSRGGWGGGYGLFGSGGHPGEDMGGANDQKDPTYGAGGGGGSFAWLAGGHRGGTGGNPIIILGY